MVNILQNNHSFENENIWWERENLLSQNADRLFGVYSIEKNTEKFMKFQMIDDVLCMYPNQIPNLEWYHENSNISILDINALRKGEIVYLKGFEKNIKNPILLSSGVIEIYGAKIANNSTRDNVFLTLRDNANGTDSEQYTSVAGRASGNNLFEEIEREQAEESPFLLQNKQWEFYLGIKSLNADFIANLENSIFDFIAKIHSQNKNSEAFIQAEKYLKKLFPKVENFDNLIKILENIVKNKNYTTYTYEEITEYPFANENIKNLQLGDTKWKFFVYHDALNNTVEYRVMERITGISEWFSLAGRSTSRLYLESLNQRPNTISATNKSKKLVPLVQFFVDTTLRKNSQK